MDGDPLQIAQRASTAYEDMEDEKMPCVNIAIRYKCYVDKDEMYAVMNGGGGMQLSVSRIIG